MYDAAGPDRRREWLAELRRAVRWHRRLLAAALAAGAIGVALTVLAPDPPRTVAVLAAARDLAGGVAVTAADLRAVHLPSGAVPDGAVLPDAIVDGWVLAGPVRRGEPLTDVRFVGASLVASLGDGLVATPVRIADAGAAALLRAGDVVDIIAAGQATDLGRVATSRVVVAGVRVLSVPSASDDSFAPTGLDDGALVVLATSRDAATDLASAAVDARLTVIVRPPSPASR